MTTHHAPPLYTPENIDLSCGKKSLGYLLSHTKNLLREIIEQELEPLDLTAAQFVVIIHLFHQPESTPADFCRILDYDPGAMTRLIDRIEKKGFIRRTQNPNDKRSVRLELTDAGRALYPEIQPKVCNAFNRLLHGFSPEESQQLHHLLERILQSALIFSVNSCPGKLLI